MVGMNDVQNNIFLWRYAVSNVVLLVILYVFGKCVENVFHSSTGTLAALSKSDGVGELETKCILCHFKRANILLKSSMFFSKNYSYPYFATLVHNEVIISLTTIPSSSSISTTDLVDGFRKRNKYNNSSP